MINYKDTHKSLEKYAHWYNLKCKALIEFKAIKSSTTRLSLKEAVYKIRQLNVL